MTKTGVDYTVTELIAALKKVPKSKRDSMHVQIVMNIGSFPSGEEGAEDWCTNATIEQVEYDKAAEIVWMEVDYS